MTSRFEDKTMNTPEWIKYDGSDEQIRDILSSKADVLFRYSNGVHRLRSSMFTGDWKHRTLTHYLICQPHPYADLIKIWADTGCPVWVKVTKRNDWVRYIDGVYYKPRAMVHEYLEPTTKPDWNIPGAEYRLTPFED